MNKFVATVLLAVVVSFSMPAQAATKSSTQSRPATPSELSLIKESFASRLKDPFSMKLTKVRIKDGTACGYVNAKNSYGAYTGFQKFFGVFAPNDKTKQKEFNVFAVNSDDNPSADGYCVIMDYNE